MNVFSVSRKPDDELDAIIAVEMSTSHASLSRTGPETEDEMFGVIVTASIKWSRQPGTPITFNAADTAFQTYDHRDHDAFSRGILTLERVNHSSSIVLGPWSIHQGWPPEGLGPDIREQPRTRLLTVPADGKLQVKHALPWSRVFETRMGAKQKLEESEVDDGETWAAALDRRTVAFPWWCWGDKEADLKTKLLLQWSKGTPNVGVPAPTPEQEKNGCVVGEDPMNVKFEFVNKVTRFDIEP